MARIRGTSKSEKLIGTDFADAISGLGGNDILLGRRGNDTLCGGGGNDQLDGGTGNDKMRGGKGRDVYIVDSAADTVIEAYRGGTDAVRTTLSSYTLAPYVENLRFTGFGDFVGTGNGAHNRIVGGYGDDVLIGGAGNDAIDGRVGEDMAIFSGKITDYTIKNVDGVVTIKDNVAADGDDGTDKLRNVEVLQFQDAKIIFSDTPSDGTLALGALDGNNGFRLIGVDAGDVSGISVSSAGDVNGDGFDDVVVGALATIDGGVYNEGETYVVFGKASWAGAAALDLASLDGINGFRLTGVKEYDASGVSVSSAGDVNGDGFADLIIGAPGADSESGYDEGESYVVFGKAGWAATPSIDLATLDGTTGFRLTGIDESDSSGTSVSSAGDVNGDGFADLIIGAPGADSGGIYGGDSYVVFGKASWAGTPSLDLASLDGSSGFRLQGIDSLSGASVSSAGDVNGDGFDDVFVRAEFAYVDGVGFTGEGYVVFGKGNWAGTPTLSLAALDGTNGFRLNPIDTLYSGGRSVASAGDVNGDGFDDLIIGAPYGAADNGQSHVVFGKASWEGAPSVDLANLDGANGFSLLGIKGDDASGWSASSAGDVNGDGFDDVIVGAPQWGNDLGYGASTGESYVVFGKASWAGSPSLDLAHLDGSNGFRLRGVDIYDANGLSVSSAGDVNGDGFGDLIVGAPGAESAREENGEGESYVIFGGNFTGAVTHLGGTGDDILTGTAAAETFVGGIGSDALIGNGGGDAFQGGAGDDVMRVSTLDFFLVDGGSGSDTLEFDGSGLDLDLTALADSRTRSLERIDIGGDGNNTLTLGALDVLNLAEESNELLVLGDAGDTVNRGTGWTVASAGGTNGNGTSTIDGETYQIYQAGNAALLVDTDMTAIV